MEKNPDSPKGTSFDLLEDKDIKRWYKNVERGSKKTADVYLRRLKGFSERIGIPIKELPSKPEEEIYNILLDFVTAEEERGLAGSYIHSSVKAAKSWLRFNRIHIRDQIRIKDQQGTPTLEDERVPTLDELHRVFLNATPRDRVCCALMAHAGLRPNVIGDSNDGLRLKDLPEVRIDNGKVVFDKIPTMIRVRSAISKAGHEYFTFLTEEGCDFLREYLELRIREGEELKPDSDLIHPKVAKKQFLSSTKVSACIRESLLKAGVKSRPYVLRAFFDTQLMIAESKGTMTAHYRKFLFGHKGDMESRYTTNKGRLTEEMIEDMREKYRQSQQFLQTTPSGKQKTGAEMRAEVRRLFYEMAGCTEEEIDKIDFDNINQDEFVEHIRKRLFESGDQGGKTSNGNHGRHAVGNNEGTVANNANGSRHIIVTPENAETLLQQGYGFVQELRGGNLILQAPY